MGVFEHRFDSIHRLTDVSVDSNFIAAESPLPTFADSVYFRPEFRSDEFVCSAGGCPFEEIRSDDSFSGPRVTSLDSMTHCADLIESLLTSRQLLITQER
jgi:hypothetical protein